MAETTSKPRRRWSFSLRTMFVVVTVLAIALTLAIRYPDTAAFVAIMLVVSVAIAAQVALPWLLSRRR